MKKKNLLFVCALVGASLATLCSLLSQDASIAKTQKMVRIGVINPVTGPLSEYGKKMQNAMTMAAAEINGASDRTWGVELVFEDAKTLPKDAVMAFQRLKRKNVDAMIVTGDLSASTIQAMVDDFGKPTLAVASAHDIPLQSKWMFRCSLPVTIGSQVLAKYAASIKAESVGMLYIKCQTGEDAAKMFRSQCDSSGLKVVMEESYDMGQSDTRVQIAKLLDVKPSLVYVFGFGPGYVSALNNLREQHFAGTILTHYEVVSEQDNIVDHGAGIFYSDIEFGEGSANAASEMYCSKYRQQFGVDSDVLSAFTYEAVRLIGLVAESQNSADAKQLREALLAVKNYPAVTGNVSFNEDGEIVLDMFIKRKLKTGSEVIDR